MRNRPRPAAGHAPGRPPVGAVAAALAQSTAAAAAVATMAGLGGRWLPLLDLASHFRLHGLLALTPGLAMAVARRQRVRTLALGVPWLISARSVASQWVPPPAPTRRHAGGATEALDAAGARLGTVAADGLRLVVFNVWGLNPTPGRVAPYVEASRADVAVIVELRPPLAARLADPMTWSYAPAGSAPRDDFYGVGVYVRRDAEARGLRVTDACVEVLRADDARQRPCVTATLHWAGRQATLIALHPPPPMGAALTRERDATLAAAAARVRASGRPGILCGDINAAPWSTGRTAASRAAPLRDAVLGHGYRGTWPAFLPRRLGIPIDVCLIDPQLRADAVDVGPGLGSDHRPLHVTLRWR